MKEQKKLDHFNLSLLWSFSVILIAWFFVFNKGITTAIDVWSVSEIFTHCFFVIPGAFYLIYKKRQQVFQQKLIPNYWLAIPLFFILILQLFGEVGGINIFMHIATFSALPLLIWMVIGNKAAKQITFPLFFMLFAIPIGEQLIPSLQQLTTNLAVPLLELTGVPVYRNGLYLDIPEGRFLVAEACSGISFLVASIVFGNLYAYLSFQKLPKQLLFVAISVIVPILANAVRVYGIVLTGHLSNMEYAVGVDHIIYGAVFYAIILFLLIVIGEKFRDEKIGLAHSLKINNISQVHNLAPVVFIIISLSVGQLVWLSSITQNEITIRNIEKINFNVLPYKIEETELTQWQPSFINATNQQQGYIVINNEQQVNFYIAAYNTGRGELISSLNKLYDDQRWSFVSQRVIALKAHNALLVMLASPNGEHREIIYWYQISDKYFVSKIKAKLYSTINLLLNNQQNQYLVAFSMHAQRNNQQIDLKTFIKNNEAIIHKALPKD